MKNGSNNKTIVQVILIILLALLAYSNTFNVPFHYDDKPVIVKNPIVQDLSYFIEPSKASDFKGLFEYKTFKNRYVGYLTFALNYKFHGLDVKGYHIVNLLIHIINSLLVYFLIFLTFKTRYMRESRIADYAGHISFFTALLFVCHPIQTQTVTYIWQRVTSLTAMFCLLSLTAYIKARIGYQKTELQVKGSGRWVRKPGSYYVTAVIFAVLAMKTKEIAFILPVVIGLYELMFFEGRLRKRVLYLVPVFLTMLIIPLSIVTMDRPLGDMIGDISQVSKEVEYISRADYLFTEFRVLVTYIRLIFLPVNQNLDYDYAIYNSFLNPGVFLSFLFLLSIFSLALYVFYRYRNTATHIRLVSFGIFWFFITLSVESSIIPIRDVINEHRMYLPSIGIFASVVTVIFSGASKIKERWRMTVVTTVLFLFIVSVLLSVTTYARNEVWKSEISLWSDVVSKSPNSRGYNNLGLAYQSAGLINKAVESFTLATEVNPEYALGYNNIANIYISNGQFDKAIDLYKLAIRNNPDIDMIHANLGSVYWAINLLDKAIKEYETAIRLRPDIPDVHLNLANVYRSKGLVNKAAEHIAIAINLKDDSPRAHLELGKTYMSQGSTADAIEEFRITLKQDPGSFVAHNNLGIIYGSSGRMGEAAKHLKDAIRIKPGYAEAHNNLGNVLRSQGLVDQAIKEYETAIRLSTDYYLAYNNLGITYGSAKRLDEAIENFKKAIQISPDLLQAHNNLSFAYLSAGMLEEAIEEYKVSIKLKPDNVSLHVNLGAAYKAKGLIDNAIESLKSALKIDPDSALAHFNLGIVYMGKGDHEIAKKEFERVLQIDPDNRNAWQVLKSLNER